MKRHLSGCVMQWGHREGPAITSTSEVFDLQAVEKVLGVSFNDRGLLRRAFTHDSYLNEHLFDGLESYERLEFLGDAVLRLVVAEHLYREVEEDEGELSRRRDKLVDEGSAARAAERLGLGQYLLLSQGEMKQSPKARILAETYEAIIGAIYLDRGYVVADEFVSRSLIKA